MRSANASRFLSLAAVISAAVISTCALLGVSGCSSGSTAGPSGNSAVVNDACQVFAATDFGTEFAISVALSTSKWTAAKTSDGLPLVQCGWDQSEAQAGSLSAAWVFHLAVHNFSTAAKAQTELSNAKVSGVAGISHEAVAGLADGAILERIEKFADREAMLTWVKGGSLYRLSAVRLNGLTRATAEQKIINIARTKF